jgi:hypothetical protein
MNHAEIRADRDVPHSRRKGHFSEIARSSWPLAALQATITVPEPTAAANCFY